MFEALDPSTLGLHVRHQIARASNLYGFCSNPGVPAWERRQARMDLIQVLKGLEEYARVKQAITGYRVDLEGGTTVTDADLASWIAGPGQWGLPG